MSLRLDWCSHAAAKYAVEHWHYSRTVPNQKTVKIGVWEHGRFIGCVIFGDGANNGMLAPFGLDYSQGCELVRVALAKHEAPVSRIVRIALLLLHRHYPSLRLVVSYADPEHGHVGGIYKAGNWIYTGQTQSADEYLVNGTRMHGRALRSTRSTHPKGNLQAANVMDWARKVLDPRIMRVPGSTKHRYIYPLDDAMREQVQRLAKPYPRPASVASDTASDQGAIGGATPTAGLALVRQARDA